MRSLRYDSKFTPSEPCRPQSPGVSTSSASQPVTADDRSRRCGHRGLVLWLTGLSGSGKSTLARRVERALFDEGHSVCVIDGDELRSGLSSDLGFTDADRAENARRAAQLAAFLAEQGIVVIAALISPKLQDRARARDIVCSRNAAFIEVHLDVPLDVCIARDPKGLYAEAYAGRLTRFTGVSAAYEPPNAPDITLRTGDDPVDTCTEELLATIASKMTRGDTACLPSVTPPSGGVSRNELHQRTSDFTTPTV